jgi:hypothetical protein
VREGTDAVTRYSDAFIRQGYCCVFDARALRDEVCIEVGFDAGIEGARDETTFAEHVFGVIDVEYYGEPELCG